MGVFDRFEKGVERAVNVAFAKAFRSEVQPVEIASALRREVDDKTAIVGRDRTLVPNTFVVELGKADHHRLGEWEEALGAELAGAVVEHADQQRYAFVGPVSVTFAEAGDLDTGVFRVRSTSTRGPLSSAAAPPPAPPASQAPASQAVSPSQAASPWPVRPPAGASASPNVPPAAPPPVAPPPVAPPPVLRPVVAEPEPQPAQPARETSSPASPTVAHVAPQPPPPELVLDVDGRPYPVSSAVTVIGRGVDTDVMLDDAGVSRRHAEITILDGRARVVDLGSTNGTFVDGERIHAGSLSDGSVITVGRTRIVVHLTGSAAAAR